ncbi:MAG: DUF4430 domain-containing protein [Clostridia bacterium]|nr:DUF4430 domain-containing protein [Clostridia bacterium]
MKKQIWIRFLSVLLAVLLLGGALPVCAASVSAHDIADGILNTEMQKAGVSDAQAWVDSLAGSVEDGREWYVFALAAAGEALDFSAYAEALHAYLSEKNIANAVTRQKYAMVLLACGYTSDFVEQTRNDSLGKLGLMSYIFGLHLANNGQAPDGVSVDEILDSLLSLRRADGGFSVTGTTSAVDDTAMAVQAMAPYYGIREDVTTAIEEALTLLSEKQTENGGFLSYGTENPESIAQVMMALCALSLDPLEDARFIKNENTMMDAILRFRVDGAFSHILGENANVNATMQVFFAMKTLEKGDSPYLLTNIDSLTHLETAPKTEAPDAPVSYKLPVILGILAAALLACVVLFFLKKRNVKHYLSVGAVALLAVLLVLLTNFQSADAYYGDTETKQNVVGEVTLSIRCDVLVGMTDSEYVPKDGVILETVTLEIEKGDTVYDVLAEATRKHKIHMETSGAGELVYIEGIAYLYELQYGDLSGWLYSVNGESASVGCGSFEVSDGDTILWEYTLELR